MLKVSIILACYNVEAYIEDAFESIIRQSAFAQFEVIPVNDGSTDRTWEIIQEYQRRYPDNFAPISFDKGSGSPGRPRNAGLDAARGEYVIFMDPDDRAFKDGYSTLLKTIEKHRSDVVIAARYAVRGKHGADKKVWVDWLADQPYVNEGSYDVKLSLLTRRPGILRSIYRLDLINQYGLRFIETISSSEDEIFDKKYLLLSNKITKINDIVYLYTLSRSESITSSIKIKIYEDLETIFKGLDDALSVYFNEAIVAYRLAGLMRAFYLPKLLLLDPDQTEQALELCHKAGEAFGFDRLMKTESAVDRRIIELLRDRNYTQLMLYFMNQRNSGTARRARAHAKELKNYEGKAVKLAIKATKFVGLSRRAARPGGLGKLWASRIRKNLAGPPNGYWVFADRHDKGSDNAEALYRYVLENKLHDKLAFIVDRSSADYARLVSEGFNVVGYNTLEHWKLLFNCEYYFASHVDDIMIRPWKEFGANPGEPRFKLVFLQHGIIRSDLSGWLGAKQYHIFCSSSRREYEGLVNNVRYNLGPEKVQLTGLARHDLLEARDGDYILVSPTWRSFLTAATEEEFRQSDFYANWRRLVYDPELQAALKAAGLHLKLLLHSSLRQFAECFEETEQVKVIHYGQVSSFAKLLSQAQMLVTDYSTISFDMLYLRRPVLYYTFPEAQKHSTNTNADLQIYADLGDLVEDHRSAMTKLTEIIGRGCRPEPEKLTAADEFFAYSDRHNRKRIIESVLAARVS